MESPKKTTRVFFWVTMNIKNADAPMIKRERTIVFIYNSIVKISNYFKKHLVEQDKSLLFQNKDIFPRTSIYLHPSVLSLFAHFISSCGRGRLHIFHYIRRIVCWKKYISCCIC